MVRPCRTIPAEGVFDGIGIRGPSVRADLRALIGVSQSVPLPALRAISFQVTNLKRGEGHGVALWNNAISRRLGQANPTGEIGSVRYNVGPLRIRLLVICNLANEPPLLTRHKICLRDLLTDFERMIDGPAYGEG